MRSRFQKSVVDPLLFTKKNEKISRCQIDQVFFSQWSKKISYVVVSEVFGIENG